MKQVIMKRLLIAAIAVLTVPATLLAQKEKEEKDQKDKEKKEMKQIIITRTGNTDEKMVIEVDGDKVKINGKDAKDVKDANVNVNTIKGTTFYRMNNFNNNGFTMNWDNNDHMSLFSEDENRAMLGVVTEGNDKGAEI